MKTLDWPLGFSRELIKSWDEVLFFANSLPRSSRLFVFYLLSAVILFPIAGAKSTGNCDRDNYSYANCREMKELIKPALLLTVVSLCLFEFVLHWPSGGFREFAAALLSLQWMLLVCVAAWCGTFLFLTFGLNDLPLIGLLFIGIVAYFIGYAVSQPATDAITILFGVTLGKGACFALMADGRWRMADGGNNSEIVTRRSSLVIFLVGLVLLLAFSSWWHLDMSDNYYHGPRWMGLWDNPNDYGMLMGAGVVLAAGLLLAARSWELEDGEENEKQKAESRIICALCALLWLSNPQSAIRNPQFYWLRRG